MSASPTSPTATPISGRGAGVLVVGEPSLLEALAARLIDPPRHADNLFDALATLGVPPDPRQHTGTVVFSADLVNGSAALVRRAFSQVDPSVRLVVIANPQAGPAILDELRDEFDACVVASSTGSIDSQQLAAVLELELRDEPAQANEREVGDVSHSVSDEPLAPGPREDSAPADTARPPVPTPEPPAAAETPLGDTDLVEAILSDPRGVAEKAMRLLMQQTGWTDAQLITAATNDAPRQPGAIEPASATVARHGAILGRLVSSQAAAAQLQPWADWLARWLALDRAYRDFRVMAYQDELTGAWNRRFFNRFLQEAINQGRDARRPVTVMVYDIDDFKMYNDSYGHEAGDEILRETVRLLTSFIRKGDRVFRIGGDEFAVVFADPEAPREPGSTHPETVERIAKRFQDQVCRMNFPKLATEAPGTLSISAGLATFPWDGDDPESLLRHADQLALFSKQRGKNVITFGPGARQMCQQQPPTH